ncbi:centromere protein K [Nycticebus coucang]|uniref:centromere protein K n=1 Tax=Nycticebus coucang TaxID=9470 RepID=UPI00234DC8C7|nr:centromere protein K [Nycticebus coucang]XP_053452232.1 centromere protein K [Nycticebus coucang]
MSMNQQDLDPDSNTDVGDITDTEQELVKECEEMWRDMEECQNKLSLIGTKTLTDSNAQLSLLILQAKCLTAELRQWQKETPEIIPLTDDVLTTLAEEEFQKLRHNLEMVLSTIQSKNEKLKEDLEREQRWLDEQQQIMESLNILHSELKNEVVPFSESRILNELKTKILNIKEYKEKLLITLGEFLEDHFPLPDGNVKKKQKNVQEPTAQLITLHEMLEILINRLFDVPYDPYVKISDSFWPPYIELLLRNGIALRHPEDPTRIRLEAFHQ